MATVSANALKKCAAALDHALEQRDGWIASTREEGHSLREIARCAQLSPEGVQHVLRRQPQRASGANAERQLERWATKAHDLTRDRARLLFALREQFSERQLAELSGLSRTAVRYQLALAAAGESPRIVRARG